MSSQSLLAAAVVTVALTCCRTATNAPVPREHASSPSSREPSNSPDATLAAMDARTPVPLLPMMANHQKQNMRDHLLAVQEIVAGVAAKDFDAIQSAVGRIGYSAQMGQMCEHMGAAAPGFTDLALKFHHTADGIGDAARNRDASGVVTALSSTLAVCTSCHQTFRQEVVDDAAWAALAKTASHSGSGAH